jgi:hypothetical protein
MHKRGHHVARTTIANIMNQIHGKPLMPLQMDFGEAFKINTIHSSAAWST